MCWFGTPQVDTTIQDQQLEEARLARQREDDRQTRIREGSAQIEETFNPTVGRDPIGADARYDPTQTYYDQFGEVWKPVPTTAETPQTAEQQFERRLRGGMVTTPDGRTFNNLLFTSSGAPTGGSNEAYLPGRDASGVNGAFSGFNDDFFKARKDAYVGFYQPQLDDQFKGARDQLTYALARAGTLNSTLAADKQADLRTKYDVQRASILSQADDDVAGAKARVNNEKSALIAQLNATGDADRVSNEALARTQQMFQEKPAYNPLGDIFAGVASGIGNYMSAKENARVSNAYFGTNKAKTGTAKVVQ